MRPLREFTGNPPTARTRSDQTTLLPDFSARFGRLPCEPLLRQHWQQTNDGYTKQELRDMPREQFREREVELLRRLTGEATHYGNQPWLPELLRAMKQFGRKDPLDLAHRCYQVDFRVRLVLGNQTGRIHRDDALHIVRTPLAEGIPAQKPNVRTESSDKTYWALKAVMAGHGWEFAVKGTNNRVKAFRRYPETFTGPALPLLEPQFDNQGRLVGYTTSKDDRTADRLEARLREKLTAPEPWMQDKLIGRIKAKRVWDLFDPWDHSHQRSPVIGHRLGAVVREFGFEEHPTRRGYQRAIYLRSDGTPMEKLGFIPLKTDPETNEVEIDWDRVVNEGPIDFLDVNAWNT